jgi:hypothetical protein
MYFTGGGGGGTLGAETPPVSTALQGRGIFVPQYSGYD